MAFEIRSSAFSNNSPLPTKYAYKLENLSPPLSWSDAPAGTKSFVIICDDPDAPVGDWVHWLVWNIPASVHEFVAGVKKTQSFSDGTIQGTNDFKQTGYDGPAPPSGIHRYFFKIFALDIMLQISPAITKAQLLLAIKGHVLAESFIVGTFSSTAK